ncbi:arginine--tRNA ligase [Amorphus orientalis]|uniref:Arginine--tRNA ligase n=1 Tax=Amorphus orientalis TaxID=649198 RepID=A0AAE3VP92_9HYPH|nr:arginine--tRNA ligase [Amorphus orientalis]MDQ0315577.1 arginyl-tRNA synthetase [Amorphus orientalis]
MNLFNDFAVRVADILDRLGIVDDQGQPIPASRIVVEPPRDQSHGDLATNAALVLAKALGRKPRDLATEIAEQLAEDADVDAVEVAGPGFVNIRLAQSMWAHVLAGVLRDGTDYGRSDAGEGAPVNVEYVSANPTGPLHVGHCRGAVVGDVIANLLDFSGYAVTREYYVNDAGAQIDTLARSAFLRYREALGEEIGAIPEGLYPGDYLKEIGAALVEAHGDALLALDEADRLAVIRPFAVERMMAMIRDDLAALSIRHDVIFSERSLVSGDRDRVAEAMAALTERGLIYQGTLPPPKGQPIEDWEDREQTLFRSSQFGDDIDRPLLKSDGSYTYFASDIAYHYDKITRGFLDMIDVLGADHGGYVKRMKAAVTALTDGKGALSVELTQLVKLFRGGEPVRMSKRAGDFVTLRDVVDEVGADAVRFMMLFRKADAPLDFDFKTVTEQSRENPVFYVQYAHARCASVLRQAGEEVPDLAKAPEHLAEASLSRLDDPGELALIAKIAEWPRIALAAAEAREPHRVAFYLHDLASAFHGHWNRGKELPHLRFINADDPGSTQARLALVVATQTTLKAGLSVLGVTAPNEMR